jgi:flagellin-like protein
MNYRKNEEAVSPVIGVILMVVITVIIAAIMAAFAFGMGAPTKAPETQLKFVMDATNDAFTMTNSGGDALIFANERITIKQIDVSPPVVLGGVDTLPLDNAAVGFTAQNNIAPGNTLTSTTTVGAAGDLIEIQVLDVPSGQLVSDSKVTVQ